MGGKRTGDEGVEEQADETVLRLSDSFDEGHKKDADIEVKVRMLNVNHGRSKELMDKCKPLAEYAWFIEEIRKNRKNHDTEVSVKMAIESMPDSYNIKGFLIGHMKEVAGMLDTEYNEAEVKEMFKEEGRAEERKNTERERKRAENAENRAQKAENRVKELEAKLAAVD